MIQRWDIFLMTAAATLCASLLSQDCQADISYEIRALTDTDGQYGPNLGQGVAFTGFGRPVMNDLGNAAFEGVLTGRGINFSNARAVWFNSSGSSVTAVAREGNQAPGQADGVRFGGFGPPRISNSGYIAFFSELKDSSVIWQKRRSLWSNAGDSGVYLLGRAGFQVPGFPEGVVFGGMTGNHAFNDNGQIATYESLAGPGISHSIPNHAAIWSERGGAGLSVVVRIGDQAPGLADGDKFYRLDDPVINNLGRIAFTGSAYLAGLSSPPNQFAIRNAIWSEGGGSGMELIVRAGTLVPGASENTYFSSFEQPVINDAGHIAFSARLAGSDVTNDNRDGIWSTGRGGSLSLVAREGDLVPDSTIGETFRFIPEDIIINRKGQTAFVAGTTAVVDGNTIYNAGIWTERGSGLDLVAQTGWQAPGLASGVEFYSFEEPHGFNSRGQVVFSSTLRGTGIQDSTDESLWMTDSNGQPHLIAREGELFNVSDDPLNPDLRTIERIAMIGNSGGEDGRLVVPA